MKFYLTLVALLTTVPVLLPSQANGQEGELRTQMLVGVDAKSMAPGSAAELTVAVNGHKEPVSGWTQVQPGEAQVALLIDDGLRESMGREIDNLRNFVRTLSPGVEILVGYMQNGHVVADQPFSTDHERAAAGIHLPEGIPGASASPYFCLSDFVKHWPDSNAGSMPPNAATPILPSTSAAPRKARFVLMVSNGVDPYNGSTSIANEDSPYVKEAITDAQRAGVAVYSIYFTDAGIRGPSASLSGQSYLLELAQGTGGDNYFEGNGNPVSMEPFLKRFQNAIARSYIATFEAPAGKHPDHDLVRVKLMAATKTKLLAPDEVLPGNTE